MSIKRDMAAIRTIFEVFENRGIVKLTYQDLLLHGGEGIFAALNKMVLNKELIHTTDRSLRLYYHRSWGYDLQAIRHDECAVYFQAFRSINATESVNAFDPFNMLGVAQTFKNWADANGITDYLIGPQSVGFERREDAMLTYMRFYVRLSE